MIPVRRLCRYFQRSAVFVLVHGLHHDAVGLPAGMRAVPGNGGVCAVARRTHIIVNFDVDYGVCYPDNQSSVP